MNRLLSGAVLVAAMTALAAVPGQAQTAVKFALDWQFEGPAAPYFVALDKGYYKDEGLEVTVDAGQGSVQNIGRIAAGTYPIGFADVNSLIKFRDQNPDARVMAVLMVYDKPPFSIVSLARAGIEGPKDLEGKKLGAPAPDGAYAQWPAFVQENGIDASKVTIENIGFPVREPMLAAGDVDAITGFSFSSFFNLMSKGVPASDIKVMLMSDHGLDLYGNVIIVNPDYAAANPEVVKGFVKATIRGWQDTAKDPEGAIKSLMTRNEIGNATTELERLKMCLRDNVETEWVKANGFGGVDEARFDSAMKQIAVTYQFKNPDMKWQDIFTSEYLPAADERRL